jgi:hypothetical protein
VGVVEKDLIFWRSRNFPERKGDAHEEPSMSFPEEKMRIGVENSGPSTTAIHNGR